MKKESEEFHLIYEHGDPVRAEIVKAFLDDAGIDCYIKNADIQNLFGLGSIGGINPLLGTVKIYIRHEDREKAETLLEEARLEADLAGPPAGPVETSAPSEADAPQGRGFLSRLLKWIKG